MLLSSLRAFALSSGIAAFGAAAANADIMDDNAIKVGLAQAICGSNSSFSVQTNGDYTTVIENDGSYLEPSENDAPAVTKELQQMYTDCMFKALSMDALKLK